MSPSHFKHYLKQGARQVGEKKHFKEKVVNRSVKKITTNQPFERDYQSLVLNSAPDNTASMFYVSTKTLSSCFSVLNCFPIDTKRLKSSVNLTNESDYFI